MQETRRVAREEGIRNLIRTNKKHEITKEETIFDLMETYNLSDEEAHKTVELFW